jgi:hypothetical protein
VADPERVPCGLGFGGGKVAEHTLASAFVRDPGSRVTDIVWRVKQLNACGISLKNLWALGEALVTEIDFRPTAQTKPQSRDAADARGSEGIQDPVMAMLYRKSKREMA